MTTNAAELLGGTPFWMEPGGVSASPAELLGFGTPAPPIPPVPVTVPSFAVIPSTTSSLQQSLGNGYGVDVLCLTDIDPNFSLTQNALAQDLFHLITESPGSIFWSANKTFSIRTLLSQGITSATVSSVQSLLQAVISADERVASCQVQCVQSIIGTVPTISATILVAPVQGSVFNFVVGINKVTITLISVSQANL